MKNNTETKIWNATLYLRLSRDDGDKEESNSITGQRELLRDFIRNRPELREYAVRIDDGFTGSNFERPDFKKMMEDVKEGRTNCIIVKDLSLLVVTILTQANISRRFSPFLVFASSPSTTTMIVLVKRVLRMIWSFRSRTLSTRHTAGTFP